MGTDTIFENDGDPRRHHHDSDERGATSGSDPFGHGSGGRGRFGRPFGRGFRPGQGFGGFGPGGPGFGGPGFGGPGFGPGRGGRGRARRGDVRLAILSLLADAPSNGYGLIKAIAERTDGAWKPSPGSVYPTLQQLVDEELIVSDEAASKSVFSLTDAGRAHVAEHSAEIEKAWAATADDASDSDREFQTSLMKLMGVVKQFHHDGSEAQRVAATAKLDETRRALYAILAD
ncbi:PadR family transcriptional regulator [Frigoribacterium sp. CFBP9039]|nr:MULTISPECIES: PadR family transcriptional regulator [unclassified Frigoribacterium]MDY0893138.1 PadR family transcriptional regulator [Frigoribacterium sp. CFBP9030]MDY0946045.1 PadR family transcriptional regulator [Frigoribacterium sp. CFBP9039]